MFRTLKDENMFCLLKRVVFPPNMDFWEDSMRLRLKVILISNRKISILAENIKKFRTFFE